MPQPKLSAWIERWPIAGRFVIARGSKSEAVVIVAQVRAGRYAGRGECVPYERYGETPEEVLSAIETAGRELSKGLSRDALQVALPPGAARNAVDCALWDYEARTKGTSVATLVGLGPLRRVMTAYTISLGPAGEMAVQAAAAAPWFPLLKIKLGGDGDEHRLTKIRAAAPSARLIVDANEAWSEDKLEPLMNLSAELGVELIEQPLPAGRDSALAHVARPVPVCADESVHTSEDLPALKGRYDAVNIKLDKTGGLTEALAMAREARKLGFRVMAGCMVATSLAMAPAFLVAQIADWADLDGPLLLARDRQHGLHYENAWVYPPDEELWG